MVTGTVSGELSRVARVVPVQTAARLRRAAAARLPGVRSAAVGGRRLELGALALMLTTLTTAGLGVVFG